MAGTSENIQAQMRKGILEYCILLILSRQASYASEIIAELKQAELIELLHQTQQQYNDTDPDEKVRELFKGDRRLIPGR